MRLRGMRNFMLIFFAKNAHFGIVSCKTQLPRRDKPHDHKPSGANFFFIKIAPAKCRLSFHSPGENLEPHQILLKGADINFAEVTQQNNATHVITPSFRQKKKLPTCLQEKRNTHAGNLHSQPLSRVFDATRGCSRTRDNSFHASRCRQQIKR